MSPPVEYDAPPAGWSAEQAAGRNQAGASDPRHGVRHIDGQHPLKLPLAHDQQPIQPIPQNKTLTAWETVRSGRPYVDALFSAKAMVEGYVSPPDVRDPIGGIITGAIKWGDANFAFPQLRRLSGHTPWPPP